MEKILSEKEKEIVASRARLEVAQAEPIPQTVTDEMIESALPKPCGFKLLVALPKVEDTYEGEVKFVKAKETVHAEQITTVVALVLDVGPDAYGDASRFPTGPWCKPGDYVLIGPYKGQRFSVFGQEYRILNDDCIEGVVPDPRGYRRI